MWPFPPSTGPTPWTQKQINEYLLQQLKQAEESPL